MSVDEDKKSGRGLVILAGAAGIGIAGYLLYPWLTGTDAALERGTKVVESGGTSGGPTPEPMPEPTPAPTPDETIADTGADAQPASRTQPDLSIAELPAKRIAATDPVVTNVDPASDTAAETAGVDPKSTDVEHSETVAAPEPAVEPGVEPAPDSATGPDTDDPDTVGGTELATEEAPEPDETAEPLDAMAVLNAAPAPRPVIDAVSDPLAAAGSSPDTTQNTAPSGNGATAPRNQASIADEADATPDTPEIQDEIVIAAAPSEQADETGGAEAPATADPGPQSAEDATDIAGDGGGNETDAPEVEAPESEPAPAAEPAQTDPAPAPDQEPLPDDEPAPDARIAEIDAPSVPLPDIARDDPRRPFFDLVRIDADGGAVIAGNAAPRSTVRILSDGVEIGTAQASGSGAFVALLDADIKKSAQAIELTSQIDEGPIFRSADQIIVLGRADAEPSVEALVEAPPPVLRQEEDAISVIQPVSLTIPDRVSLDVITYGAAAEVVLVGRGQPGRTARIYIDDAPTTEVVIEDGGRWRANLPDIAKGLYTLRVDEIADGGVVSSRVESPFKRVIPAPETLAALSQDKEIIVQPGNNLWTIARNRYGRGIEYTVIFDANKDQIRDPDLIYPGQVFALPQQN